MHNYKQVSDIANNLIQAVAAKDSLLMQEHVDVLNKAYETEFGDEIESYDALHAFVLMNLASARYFSFNNMYNKVHERYEEIASRMEGIRTCGKFSENQIAEIDRLFVELEKIHKETPERHQNLVIERMDTRCSLCRTLPANKTGAHMVPNFLAHPTFSWDACVSTYEGGIADIVDEGETGFLVPCREVAPLAERISILLKDEALRKRFGEAGRIKFEEEYTLQRFEENIKRCLEACLQK